MGTIETQASITQWANETFGPATNVPRVVARANEEMAELLRKVTAGTMRMDGAAEEIADVVIVLCRVATLIGADIATEIDKKMAINRKRVWKKDGTGHGYHVREKEKRPMLHDPLAHE